MPPTAPTGRLADGLEIESVAELRRRLRTGVRDLRGWHLQSLDLRGISFDGLAVTGLVCLGCRFDEGAEDDLRRRGALVFPAVPDVPFDPYRGRLYSPDELYAGLDEAEGYAATVDARVYAWTRGPRSLDRTLAAALHDHAVDDALEEYVDGRSVCGVMGGHALERGSAGYRDATRLGRALATGHTVATGGGPGAMEAANLGASLPDRSALEEAVDLLATVPSFRPDVTAWARTAREVGRRWPLGDSLGVPTWHYGHEPPNLFARHTAKYFTNAIREDVLLHVCTAGLVFLPGAAGTVQEVFQAACEVYYAEPGAMTTLVLVGRDHWTSVLPAWPLLERLTASRGAPIHLVDTVDEAADLLAG